MTTQRFFMDSIGQDQTSQNMESDLWSTLSTNFILDYNLNLFFILQWKYTFSQWKTTIYLFGNERDRCLQML